MVKELRLPVIWDSMAIDQLQKAYERILKESYQGAITVRNGIIDAIDKIQEQPYKYPSDRFKKNNTGNYRAFELYSYRIAYKITDKEVLILRLRHVKQEPLPY